MAALAYQNRAPSVHKAATADPWDRTAPSNQAECLTAEEVTKVCAIFERIFGEVQES